MRTFIVEYKQLGKEYIDYVDAPTSVMAIKQIQKKFKRAIKLISIRIFK